MSMPRLFGAYLLLEELEQGSTSEVYLARTVGQFSRLCTVKIFRAELAALPEFQRRFRQDAALLVRLIHGNLVQILEVGLAEDRYFIAMEHVDGVTLPGLLAETAEQDEALPVELALFVGLEMCEVLSYIAMRRREVEGRAAFSAESPWPLELMLSFDGVLKVIDLGSFGAVRLGAQKVSRLFQSPGYAVPEVILKKELDARADIFAVGMVVWQLLQGRQLVADNPTGYVRRVMSGEWKAPLIARKDVSGDIIRAVATMLSLDPARRPRSLEEARDPLVNALRRMAPSFGSGALSGLLMRRCPSQLGRADEIVARAMDREVGSSEPSDRQGSSSRSFGLAGEVDREIGEPVKLEVGRVIPGTRYKMVRLLGKGWTGEVYAAQHMDLERRVALKILSPDLARRSRAIEVFRMEARACSRVGHQNIVDVTDFGELTDGRFFFAMEMLEGESLARLLRREGTLPPDRAIGIFRQVTRALQAVHLSGIVHRDLKPENIMLVEREGREDFVKILDFGGKAFLNRDGEGEAGRAGTTGYMAPELVRNEVSTAAMDVYATGMLLYRVLCGELPYPTETFEMFEEAQAAGPVPALRRQPGGEDVPEALERVVHRALERDPEARHPSMADLEEDLIKAQHEAGLVTPYDDLPPPSEVLDPRVRRRAAPPKPRPASGSTNRWVLAGVVGGVILLLLVVLVVEQRRQPPGGGAPSNAPRARRADQGETPSQPRLTPAHQELLRQAEEAASRGRFTNPEGACALDLMLQVERQEPGNQETRQLRLRYARLLEGAGDRLVMAKAATSARTLYREALLFTPGVQRLEKLAYPPAAAGGASKPSTRRERPTATEAEVAWLLSMTQLAVGEGRYIVPSGENALFFLRRLKLVDPTGKRSAAARQKMSLGMWAHVEDLIQKKELAKAKKVLSTLALLNPEDKKARTRLAEVERDLARAAKDEPKAPPARSRIAPSSEEKDAAAALVKLGRAAMSSGKLGKAEGHFRGALKADPTSGAAALGLATVAFEQGKNTRAVELARRAVKLGGDAVKAYLLLGDANFNLRRVEAAAKAWRRVLKLRPGHRAAQARLDKLKAK